MSDDKILEQLREYIRKHGAPPKELLQKQEKLTKEEYNSYFLSLPVTQQIEEINAYKKNRWKMGRVPSYIMGEIDMSDDKEVRMWKAIDRKRRFPFLKNAEAKDYMHGTVIFKDRVAHGVQITNLDASGSPTMGTALDYNLARLVWVELLSVSNRTWQEVCEV